MDSGTSGWLLDATHPMTEVLQTACPGLSGWGNQERSLIMPTLWTALRSRWLDSGGAAGVDHLSEHLRRDIGLTAADRGVVAPHHIHDRNLSDARTFLTLQPYR